MKINYITLGTNHMKRATQFYDELLYGTPFQKAYGEGPMTMWVSHGLMFALAEPYDGQRATVANGSMIGLQLDHPSEVDRLHALALSLGGEDEGTPAVRDGHHSAYVRDLDGHKLCLFA